MQAAISDLFFNYDHEQAKLKDSEGNFDGFNEEMLEDNADSFLFSLESLGVGSLPSKQELIEDLHSRM